LKKGQEALDKLESSDKNGNSVLYEKAIQKGQEVLNKYGKAINTGESLLAKYRRAMSIGEKLFQEHKQLSEDNEKLKKLLEKSRNLLNAMVEERRTALKADKIEAIIQKNPRMIRFKGLLEKCATVEDLEKTTKELYEGLSSYPADLPPILRESTSGGKKPASGGDKPKTLMNAADRSIGKQHPFGGSK